MSSKPIDYKKRVCLAMNFISKNIERDLTLEEIAEVAAFSVFHFHRIFKAVVGETVAGFTRRLRLELAANHLLSRQTEDITTIAFACGFSSSQNFAKAFRQHFDMTPSEYRKSKIGNILSNSGNETSLQVLYNSNIGNPDDHKRSNVMNFEVREMPEQNVAYIRKIGPYCKETCEPAFNELLQWAGPRNLLGPGKMLAIYWDNPEVTPPEKCRFDTCVIVPEETLPEGQINIQTICGGNYAVFHFEIATDNFQQAWEDAFVGLCESGYECGDKPCLEIYHNHAGEHPEGKWIFDICIPLK